MENFNEKMERLLEELIEGVENGVFSTYENDLSQYRWEHLMALYLLSPILEGGSEYHRKIYDVVINSALFHIRRKAQKGEIIKVLFLCYSAAQWPAGEVYKRLKEDSRYDVKIMVPFLEDRDNEGSIDIYKQTSEWFKDNGYDVIEGYDLENNKVISLEEINYVPDVLYMVTTWYEAMPKEQQFIMLSLNTIVGFIDYGIKIIDNENHTYMEQYLYTKNLTNVCWRVYCNLVYEVEKFKEYNILKGINTVFSGYPKMDYFYKKLNFSEEEIKKIWKIPQNKKINEVKKIIIAPHFSVGDDVVLKFSTFKSNMWYWIYLMKKYTNISFVFKPHPNLRTAAVNEKIFNTYEEYDDYIKKIDSLPNAKVVTESSYLEYFATSDSLIFDSCSFLAEYMYVKKPALFLRRKEQNFLQLGQKVLETYYEANGEDYYAIENFIKDVVLGEKDTLKEKRQKIFNEYFDYKKINKKLASETICDDLNFTIFER
ncbi:CDP-glycerol glycerophosphotransferase family protein [Lachnobacterium bovis]|uniref:CDP-glycerol glycerophosphotransferase family protein n=1 Tax=Lachnobacterium bovis TaxID=140626 RepID=UPI0003B4E624|nr:CDP-glycerol glycerophosphotransferase family protein [Lachnobacterium bovis]